MLKPGNRTRPWTLLLLACASPVLCFGRTINTQSVEERAVKTAYEEHRWFELREAIRGAEASPLYLGSVASAFNDTHDAERYLKRAIESAANADDAAAAHEALGDLYARLGRNREAVVQMDAILKIEPARSDVENVRPVFAAWGKHPDQSVATYKRSILRADVGRDGIVLPISIHGKTVHWALDTGFNFSLISESEARMLGIPVDETSVQAADKSGGTARLKTAVVDELAIGNVKLKDVPFLVEPDSQPPMDELEPGRKGLIGFPVALALKAIAWKSDGTFEIGFPEGTGAVTKSNLCIDGFDPVTRVPFEGKELDFVFDTGNEAGTQLWARFGSDFPALMKRGIAGKKRVTQVGGSNEREVVILSQIQLRVGGLETALKDVPVFSKPVGDDFHYGLLGIDVISQAHEVRVDFRSMTLQLLP